MNYTRQLRNFTQEKELHDMYEFYLGMNDQLNIEYYAFDFHKECANNKYEKCSSLYVVSIQSGKSLQKQLFI